MPIELVLLTAIIGPLLIAPSLVYLVRWLGNNVAWIAVLVASFSAFIISRVGSFVGFGDSQVFSFSWIPSLNISLSFLVDGVSLFFGLVVTLMGAFVCFYARYYLHETRLETGRFYAYILLFMSAMLGTVFSNNLLSLFVFWELTGIASFLLIGFSYTKEASQKGALMALLTTGGTGLILLVGIIVLGFSYGTFDFSELLKLPLVASPFWLNVAFVCMIIGAFGKSAQFPFHFWLPNAMAAPTPVSAYLHSAAMVKLGIFLTARMYPILIYSDLWVPILLIIGFFTMTLGAIFALLSHDLKGILAFTTVSQLGFFIGFYGLGSAQGVEHDFFHILNHVFYKGALFMIAGIVIHSVGTKDIRKMKGLFSSMPLTAIACFLACAAMAGIPGTSGFISKELMLGSILSFVQKQGGLSILLFASIITSAACLFAIGLRLCITLFVQPAENSIKHKPGILFQLPPFILSSGVLFLGLFPHYFGSLFEHLSTKGLHIHHFHHLAIFHGINTPLLISASALLLGGILFFICNSMQWSLIKIPLIFRFDDLFLLLLQKIQQISHSFIHFLRLDKPLDYMVVVIGFITSILLSTLFPLTSDYILPQFMIDQELGFLDVIIPLLISLFALGVVFVRRWTGRLISLSVVGFLISFYFMLYRAPDLALTQMLIETVSLVLILLLLGRFPAACEKDELRTPIVTQRKFFNGVISIGAGLAMFTLIILVLSDPSDSKMGPYFIETTNSLAGGANAVNTILVDYRGFDTMGEISVLVIAMLGVIGLIMGIPKLARKEKGAS